MNALQHLTPAVMSLAIVAAAFSVQAPAQAAGKQPVLVLPTVTVVGQRASLQRPTPVVVLPTVTVIGKREALVEPTRVARREAAAPARF